jgi:hypothetical protein
MLAWLALGAIVSQPARAEMSDPLIEGAKLCTRHLAQYERENGIPTHLLSAIASTESGRYHEGLKIAVPWPWTINANRKGYFFKTKEDAIAAARKFRARGINSIDVGCMQVNLVHHADAFASLDQAFDPETNIAYASNFLHTLYQEDNSWRKAAADYHSRTPSRGSQYVNRVYNSWYRIIDKLRAARLQVPESSVVAMNAMQKENQRPLRYTRAIAPVKVAKVQIGKVEQTRAIARFKATRVNTIQLSDARPIPRSDVITVQPQAVAAIDASYSPSAGRSVATPSTLMTLAPMALPDVRVVQAPRSSAAGPNFIFND